jgi:CD109 antigen
MGCTKPNERAVNLNFFFFFKRVRHEFDNKCSFAEGMVYWSREPVPSNQILYENQRPFLQPRLPMQQDAVAVEATSYALLVYLARDGIGDLQERVVTWLNTMRMVDGGFVSIYVIII